MPSIATDEAAKLLGGKVYISESRVRIAQIMDELFMHGIKLFDLSSISRLDLWAMKYARLKLFQKMQTLFQMGKKKELLEMIDYIESAIPALREFANAPDIFITASGATLDEKEAERRWHEKPIPKNIEDFIKQTSVWKEVLKDIP